MVLEIKMGVKHFGGAIFLPLIPGKVSQLSCHLFAAAERRAFVFFHCPVYQ